MPGKQVVDEIADDRVRLVAELGHHPADQGATPGVPFQVDGAMRIPATMDFRPAMRTARLLGPDLDELKFRLQLRIAHDLVPQ